jgi:hypothetical protein
VAEINRELTIEAVNKPMNPLLMENTNARYSTTVESSGL